MFQFLSKKQLANTKLLLEGKGFNIENKNQTPFTGFRGCYTVITCNSLPYPFTEPVNSTAGITEEEWGANKKAIETRCTIFTMTQEYNHEQDIFPFSEKQLAHMLLHMYDHYTELPIYEEVREPNDFQIIMNQRPNSE